MKPKFVHVVMPAGATPPLYVFTPSDAAYVTARAILGVDVVTLPLLESVPASILEDLERDFDEDDVTPEVVIEIEVD